jgi:hypothetical protein
MAVQWGNNTLAGGEVAGFYFVRPVAAGFLPIISVLPVSPSFTPDGFSVDVGLTSVTFPFYNQLGVSNMWSQMTDDGINLVYSIVVMNFSNNTVGFAFVEADL